ncbi:MAG: hypothetical protein ACQEUT_12080 [Bacillota bacterium]
MAKIHFNKLLIDRIVNGSGVFYGENSQYKWTKTTRKSDGLGYVKGNSNTLANNLTVVAKDEKDRWKNKSGTAGDHTG